MSGFLFAFCVVSFLAYTLMWRDVRKRLDLQRDAAARLLQVDQPPALFSLDLSGPARVLDDGSGPVRPVRLDAAENAGVDLPREDVTSAVPVPSSEYVW